MIDFEAAVKKLFSSISSDGKLTVRESSTLEYKKAFNKGSVVDYAKTMAAFANNKGGYLIFGVIDTTREVVGLQSPHFDNLKQEEFTETINSYFSPEIIWTCGSLTVDVPNDGETRALVQKKIGWIYAYESERKPIVALKANSNEKLAAGDVVYRYRARTQRIRPAEMERIIENRIAKERENLLKLFETIRKNGTANIGIVNYNNGRVTTPYGVDIAFDRKLITKVLRKAKYIKEGSFNETEGKPVLKVTGNIDLAEEVPVPDGNPDETHPFIQKQLAEKLGISREDLYALIWYYKMKEARKYHIQVTTSRSGKTHKFSNFALQFLSEKLKELNGKPEEFNAIRMSYKARGK